MTNKVTERYQVDVLSEDGSTTRLGVGSTFNDAAWLTLNHVIHYPGVKLRITDTMARRGAVRSWIRGDGLIEEETIRPREDTTA